MRTIFLHGKALSFDDELIDKLESYTGQSFEQLSCSYLRMGYHNSDVEQICKTHTEAELSAKIKNYISAELSLYEE